MRRSSCATDALLVIAALAGCSRRAPVRDDAAGSGSAISDAAPDAVIDAAPDAPIDAAVFRCPPWTRTAAAGRRWLYARVDSSDGVLLTPHANHVDVYVRATQAAAPGERADADDPCAVASYDQSAAKVRILAAALGFSTVESEVSPTTCGDAAPCIVVLPKSLDPAYYAASTTGLRVRAASELAAPARTEFAAAVAGDALQRSKVLHHDLAAELDSAAVATDVPAPDLAIHYTEARLHKKCDAKCLTDQTLDPAMRTYLGKLRRPGRPDPFDSRTPPEHWQPR